MFDGTWFGFSTRDEFLANLDKETLKKFNKMDWGLIGKYLTGNITGDELKELKASEDWEIIQKKIPYQHNIKSP